MMTDRRKLLMYSVLGLLVVGQAGNWLYGKFVDSPRKARSEKIESLEKDVVSKTRELKRARRAADLLATYEAQSLPADPELARTAYTAWLLGLMERAKFRAPSVDAGTPMNRKGMYQSLSFSVRGQATLAQLTQFLYEFYRADHLHQIRSLAITPLRSEGRLDLSLGIEALLLPTSQNVEGLSTQESQRLAYDAPADYRGIVQRDLFGVGGALDPVAQTFLSGVTATDGRPEAWFTLRATDQSLKLKAGESLEVGPFQGTVVEIDESDVVLESEGKRWLLSIGESLDQASALPPEF